MYQHFQHSLVTRYSSRLIEFIKCLPAIISISQPVIISMIFNLICCSLILNGFLIYLTTGQLFYVLCVLQSICILFVTYRLSTKKKVKRLASLSYNKMEIYYKKHLNNAMCASCKFTSSSKDEFHHLFLSNFRTFFFKF